MKIEKMWRRKKITEKCCKSLPVLEVFDFTVSILWYANTRLGVHGEEWSEGTGIGQDGVSDWSRVAFVAVLSFHLQHNGAL